MVAAYIQTTSDCHILSSFWLVESFRPFLVQRYHSLSFERWYVVLSQFCIFCQSNVGHCYFQWFSVVHCGSPNHSNGLCAFSMVWKGNIAGKQRKTRNLCSNMSITNGYQWFPTIFLEKKSFKTWNPNDECSHVAPRTVLFGPADLGFNLLWGWQRCVECERPLVEFPQRKKWWKMLGKNPLVNMLV